jgi:hypothetical protein
VGGNGFLGAGDGTHHGDFVASATLRAATIILVPIVFLAADESLVHLNNADELLKVAVLQARANAMTHVPSGAIGTEPHPGTSSRIDRLSFD